MEGVSKINSIIKILRVAMYFLVGMAIIFLPIPLFQNTNIVFRIAMGLLFALYAGFRLYQHLQQKKNQSDE